MAQAPRFVHIVDEVPGLDDEDGLVLVHALDGFLDAGHAAALAIGHLVELDTGPVVASFDIDEFYDYRARRPAMTFVEDHYESYDAPRLVVRLQRDSGGAPYLLLHGPEPDTHWEAFARAVHHVVETFGVRLTVSLGSVPMAVPHTRPITLTHHATSSRLLVRQNVWRGEIRIPSSAQALLEVRLGEWGHDAMGFVAHIPHYIAQYDYPVASVTMLESVGEVSGLSFDVEALRVSAAASQAEISAQIGESDEVREVVVGLEQQYDAFHRAGAGGPDLLAEGEAIPTGEEIGAQFEQFLAGLDGPDRPDDRS